MTMRPVLFLHRWLGIAVGLVMTVWCLSGFVMMYSPYPRLDPVEQLRGLAPLQMPQRIDWMRLDLAEDTMLSSARIERLDGRTVLRIAPAADQGRPIAQMRAAPETIDLASGRSAGVASKNEAVEVGRTFGERYGVPGVPLAATPVKIDQWTVQTAKRHQPLWRVDFAGGDTAYVAGSGEVVQHTTRMERFWGWLGAVPHWLYPTVLRQNGAMWSQVVIWTSLAGCFLTITGLWVGLARLRRNREGRIGSPYRGLWWWHHMAGLFFGVLTLTWVASGLFSMNPWGFLDSDAGLAERERLNGSMQWIELREALTKVRTLPRGTVRIETASLGDRIYLVMVDATGNRLRYDADGRPAPLSRPEIAAALGKGARLASLDLLLQEDAYYYAHKNTAPLPVWRAILADDQATRLYIDQQTGRIVRAFDANGRSHRWLMNGMHSLDLPGLRARPLWDLVVLPLLAMVTLVCATGTCMGVSKVRRDLRRSRNRRRRKNTTRSLKGAPA